MKHDRQDDLDTLDKGRPYLRSTLAFLVYLRFGRRADSRLVTVDAEMAVAYATADGFIGKLTGDMERAE